MEVQRFYAGYAVPISWGKIVKPMTVRGFHGKLPVVSNV